MQGLPALGKSKPGKKLVAYKNMPQDDIYRVVRVTNISNFDFTGELGARYHGRDFEIRKGKSLLAPYPVGKHLAKHLARQILLKKAPIRDGKETDGKGTDRPLWDDKIIGELIAKIMTEAYTEEKPEAVSETDKMVEKVRQLNKSEKEVEREQSGGNAPFNGTVDENPGTAGEITYKDKSQVIAELAKRGIKFNARDTRANLESLLTK